MCSTPLPFLCGFSGAQVLHLIASPFQAAAIYQLNILELVLRLLTLRFLTSSCLSSDSVFLGADEVL